MQQHSCSQVSIWNSSCCNVSWLTFNNVLYSEDNRERKHGGTRKRKYWIRLSFHPFLFGSLDEPNTYPPIKHFHKSIPDNYSRMFSGELINIKRCMLKGMSPLFKTLNYGCFTWFTTELQRIPREALWAPHGKCCITEEPFYYLTMLSMLWCDSGSVSFDFSVGSTLMMTPQ